MPIFVGQREKRALLCRGPSLESVVELADLPKKKTLIGEETRLERRIPEKKDGNANSSPRGGFPGNELCYCIISEEASLTSRDFFYGGEGESLSPLPGDPGSSMLHYEEEAISSDGQRKTSLLIGWGGGLIL